MWEYLAEAIVIMAAHDYREACTRRTKYSLRTIIEIERFFNSSWGDTLSDGKAKDILKRLQKELKT